MKYCFRTIAVAMAFAATTAEAGISLATWNLGWHVSQKEAGDWVASCNKRYELDAASKAWNVSTKADAQTGWLIDWRPRDEAIKLPWTIDKMPPCNIYQDGMRNVIPVTADAFAARSKQIAQLIEKDIAADVMAFQEVSGEAAVREVLGGLSAQYNVCSYDGYAIQRLAFAWKKSLAATGICEVNEPLSLPQNGAARRPRPGLRLMLNLGKTTAAFLNVHLKASCVSPLEAGPENRGQLESEQKDCVILQQQIQPLEAWLEETAKKTDRIVFMGDFNRDLWHEVEAARTGAKPRVDGSDPKSALKAETKVRLLLAEINDGEPAASALVLSSNTCAKSDAAKTICNTAKTTRLSRNDRDALALEMGCRNPVGLDQMLVSRAWPRLPEPLLSNKIAIVPFGISQGATATTPASLAASDHCPLRMELPSP
jgi:endonuclease/exonuclease/phosphatase family metal-dependent hydrolase